MDAAQAAALLDRLQNLEQYAHAAEERFAALAAHKKAPSLRIPDPWDGKGDAQLNFIIPMGAWLAHHDMQDSPTCIPFLLHNLPALLQLRYRKHELEAAQLGNEMPQTAAEFFALVEQWVPARNRLREARERLQKLRHYKGKIYQYNNLFSELVLEVGDMMSQFDLNWIYVHGLQPDVMREVDMHITLHTTPLSEVMIKASNAESRLRDLAEIMGPVNPKPYYPAGGFHGATRHAPSNGNDPMELGMIRRNKSSRHIKQPFRGNCYKCGQPGHRSDDCNAQRRPSAPAHAPRGRRR
jgi:Zinc knuckle